MFKHLLIMLVLLVSTTAQAALNIQHWTLENGTRVYFVENHSIPMLDVSVEFDAGARRDPKGKSGVAALTNSMLGRGVRAAKLPSGVDEPALTEAQISDAFADIAAQRGGGPGVDRSGLSVRSLSSATEREQAILLIARLLAHPSMPEDFLARDKARSISSIKEAETKPESIADKAFWRLAYGDHPYANESTVQSVSAITREDLLQFHATHYVANRAVIAMIGDISRAQADEIARQLTARLPQGGSLPSITPVVTPQAEEQRIPHPASQAHIVIGMPALQRGDADVFALTVGNYILGGGGFVSRLTKEVRVKRGLAYSVYSYFNAMEQPGPYQAGLQTRKDQADEALKVVREQIASYLQTGPTEAELKAAKDNLIGGFALRIDNNRKILDNIAVIGYYQMPLDYLDTWTTQVAKVTLADVRAAFNRKLAMDKIVTVVVGGANN